LFLCILFPVSLPQTIPKQLQHLEILTNLRNLQEIIAKLLEKMALTYNLENDLRFKQGLHKGLQKGLHKGIHKGKNRKAIVAIKEMLADGLPFDLIARYLHVSVDFVQKVAEKVQKNK
jgi:hypothetical protein